MILKYIIRTIDRYSFRGKLQEGFKRNLYSKMLNKCPTLK
jgi:hypothetical protein